MVFPDSCSGDCFAECGAAGPADGVVASEDAGWDESGDLGGDCCAHMGVGVGGMANDSVSDGAVGSPEYDVRMALCLRLPLTRPAGRFGLMP